MSSALVLRQVDLLENITEVKALLSSIYTLYTWLSDENTFTQEVEHSKENLQVDIKASATSIVMPKILGQNTNIIFIFIFVR
jgi:hypothetical protein